MNEHYMFVNPPLPYQFDGLQPYIDTETMELHHNRHLQGYVDNLNNVLKDYPQLQHLSLEQLISNVVFFPAEIQTPVLNNAGGVFNHELFFFGMTDKPTMRPVGILDNYLNMVFGNFEEFKKQFTAAAMSVFGSGYAWLLVDRFGMLRIRTTPNQVVPKLQDLYPVLNIDVWEHAYYLKHYNLRADYINDWFQVVNWDQANANFLNGISGEFANNVELSPLQPPQRESPEPQTEQPQNPPVQEPQSQPPLQPNMDQSRFQQPMS